LDIPTFTSERLILRPYSYSDFAPLAALYQTPHSRYIDGPRPAHLIWRDFASDVGQWHLLGFGCLSIEEKSTGAFVGQCGLNAPPEYPEREIGWVLLEEFEGKGYAFEAASVMRDFAFKTLGWQTVVSYIDPDNARSIKLAERMGAFLDKDAATPNSEGCLVYRHLATPLPS
jgi:RimJ/RimL family protein N-acetyltransferase